MLTITPQPQAVDAGPCFSPLFPFVGRRFNIAASYPGGPSATRCRPPILARGGMSGDEIVRYAITGALLWWALS